MIEINIRGIGAYAPLNVVTNDDLSKIVDTSDEWISSRTGIKERRISVGEDTSNISINSAKMALERSDIKSEDIDLIIVATITPDMVTPSVACLVQKEIGAVNAMAFDVNAACSGFIYALQVAYSMMYFSNNFKNALVIGAEILSKIIDWNDRRTCVLFGDGGGAVILSKEDTDAKKYLSFYSKSKGDKGEYLTSGAFDVSNPFIKEEIVKNKKVCMNGREVFKFATTSIVDAVKNVLSQSDLTIDDIDYIIPHQANSRIIEYSAKKLKIDMNKFYINLGRYGNTSSASIPLALNEMYESNKLSPGIKLIMVGFGGGLTYGAVLIEL